MLHAHVVLLHPQVIAVQAVKHAVAEQIIAEAIREVPGTAAGHSGQAAVHAVPAVRPVPAAVRAVQVAHAVLVAHVAADGNMYSIGI